MPMSVCGRTEKLLFWAKMSVSRLANPVKTYPERSVTVIAAKGGATKWDT